MTKGSVLSGHSLNISGNIIILISMVLLLSCPVCIYPPELYSPDRQVMCSVLLVRDVCV